MAKLLLLVLIFSNIGCQKAPFAAQAADPKWKHAKAPMGSPTSNTQLVEKEKLLGASLIGKPENDRKLAFASFYFEERRFIEAAFLLSEILDRSPKYPNARSMLARCFYFLGNEDRAQRELEYVLRNQNDDMSQVLDALYLSGAIPLESETQDKKKIKNGIGAFKTYLKLAKDSPEKQHIEDNIKKLYARLN